jgi:hypothetical protein
MTLIRTSKTRRRLSRRALLGGLGASTAFLPLLDVERAKAAGESGFPKRLVTITWGHGVCQSAFYPKDLGVSSEVLAPMQPYASKLLLAAGLDYKMMLEQGHTYDGHFTYPVIYTGTYKNTGEQNCIATGPSIDQVVSDAIAKQVALPAPLLVLSIGQHRRGRSEAPIRQAVCQQRHAERADRAYPQAPPERARLRVERAD